MCFYTVCFVCFFFPAPAGTAASIAILRDALSGTDRRFHRFPNCECNKISSFRVFFPSLFVTPPTLQPKRRPKSHVAPHRLPDNPSSDIRPLPLDTAAGGSGNGQRFRNTAPVSPVLLPSRTEAVPLHGNPVKKNRKHRPAAGRNYHNNQCKLFLKGQYQAFGGGPERIDPESGCSIRHRNGCQDSGRGECRSRTSPDRIGGYEKRRARFSLTLLISKWHELESNQ